jgi:exosortase/archaeosortase family protein
MMDWKRLHVRRYFVVFPLALLGLFACNILRVFGLVMAGYYINPRIAFSLFHTYAGMLFFILYSAIFWALAYRHLLKKDTAPSNPHTS